MSEQGKRAKDSPLVRATIGIIVLLVLTALLFWLDPRNFYLWVKALHVIAVIAWMAGMLYLPRLFVYHAEAGPGNERSKMLKVMERRLLRAIINPAMMASWVFGLWLAWEGFRFQGAWLHVKILLVLALSALHGYFSRQVRAFDEDRHEKSARYWRVINEAVTVLMIGIVVLVVVKPF